MNSEIKRNGSISYYKLKLQKFEQNNRIKAYLSEMELKNRQKPKIISSPNRIKSAFFMNKKVNLELKENSAKSHLKLNEEISSLNNMFQDKKKSKTIENFYQQEKTNSKEGVKKDKYFKNDQSSNIVKKIKNTLDKTKEIISFSYQIPMKSNKKKRNPRV